MTKTWDQARTEALAAMTADERGDYDQASMEAESRLQLAELVYNARAAVRITQTELARRAGTSQAVISAIETGAQAPGGIMLERISAAIGGTLRIDLGAEKRVA